MHVVLEVSSGPSADRKASLARGHTLKVGRTQRADLVLPDDSHLSSLHFALECGQSDCRIRDLDSSNGTFLNGNRIAEATVRDGDKILAGQTTFVVRIGAAAASGSVTVIEEAPVLGQPATRFSYIQQSCESGLLLLQGTGEAAPAPVARRLSQLSPMYLVADFNRLPVAKLETIEASDFLFDWMPDEVRADVSPALLAPSDSEDRFALIEQGWGKDALLCIFSKSEKAQLFEHLRSVLRGKKSEADEPPKEQMLGFCWPGVVAQLLAHQPAEPVGYWMSRIDAIFLESKRPPHWQLFSSEAFADGLEKHGFVRETT